MENKDNKEIKKPKQKTKKLKPNIILVEEETDKKEKETDKKETKTEKKTRKVKAKPNIEFIIIEEESLKKTKKVKVVKEKKEKEKKEKKERKTRKYKEKELITNYQGVNEEHKLEGIGNIKEPIEDIIIPKVSKEKSLKTMQVKQIEMN